MFLAVSHPSDDSNQSLSDMLRSHSWLGLWFCFTRKDHLHGQRPRGLDFTVIRLEMSCFVFLYRKKRRHRDERKLSFREITWAPLIRVFQLISKTTSRKDDDFSEKHYLKISSSFCLKLLVKEGRRLKDPLWATCSAPAGQQEVLLCLHAQTQAPVRAHTHTPRFPLQKNWEKSSDDLEFIEFSCSCCFHEKNQHSGDWAQGSTWKMDFQKSRARSDKPTEFTLSNWSTLILKHFPFSIASKSSHKKKKKDSPRIFNRFSLYRKIHSGSC